MFCQPAVKQLPIKAVLNSAVIPIPASQFGVHYLLGEGGDLSISLSLDLQRCVTSSLRKT